MVAQPSGQDEHPSALSGEPNVAGARGVESSRLGEATIVDCGRARGRDARVLPSEGEHVWLEVSFQGRGTLLGREITDTGTYRQTFRPGGVLAGEGHVLMITDTGDLADWVGGGVGRQTGPGYPGQLRRVGFVPVSDGCPEPSRRGR